MYQEIKIGETYEVCNRKDDWDGALVRVDREFSIANFWKCELLEDQPLVGSKAGQECAFHESHLRPFKIEPKVKDEIDFLWEKQL